MLRPFTFFALLFTTLTILHAQPGQPGKIAGKVSDPSNAAVEYATVVLFKGNDTVALTGTSTDEYGEFIFENLPLATYRISISFLGFETKTIDSLVLSAERPQLLLKNPVVLSDNTKVLGEVVVEDRQDMVQYGIDKKIYNPGQDIVSKGGTATDVLQNIPSVQLDADRNLQFRGSSNITVYIDGKPSTLTGADRTAILDQIPAENIERIEIISNPSAKFDAEGSAGIINIVTKKGKKDGYNGAATLNIGSGQKYQGNLLLNVKKGKWNFGASYGFNQQRFWSSRYSFRELEAPTYSSQLKQVGNGVNNGLNHTGRFTVDYQIKNFQTLSLSSGTNSGNRDDSDLLSYLFYHTGTTLDSSSSRQTNQDRTNLNTDVSLSYRKASLIPDKYLNADINFSNSGETENMRAFQPYYAANGNLLRSVERQNTSLNRKYSLWTMQVDKSDPLPGKIKIESGLKATLRNIDNDFLYERQDTTNENFYSDVNLTNRFVYKEQVYAAYGTFTKSYRRFGYSAGLRLEHTLIRAEQVTTGQKFNQDYLKFFPSAYVSYKITDKTEVQANYSRRINRPGMFQLNPFANYSDPLNLQTGNPFLKPELTNSYELNIAHQSKKYNLSGGIYWKNTIGQIIRYRRISENGVTVTSFENLQNSRSIGVEGVAQYSPFKWWRMNANANFYQVNMKAGNLAAGLASNAIGGNVRVSSSFMLKKVADFQVSYSYMRPGWALQGTIQAFQAMDVAVKRDVLNGKGSVSLRVSDVFNQRQFAFVTIGENFYQENTWKRESRIAYLSFSYRFGNDKIAAPKKRPANSGSEEMMDF